ncbi:response regulator transcription factor [Poseidonocella sp. HB161398]|uniref:response regulator transcription factor n=1 Tax=Poseidonocella sp. HB161398 TaxID=2320855 RepID=UPI00110942B8|nr:response regulator transcription factor [Poseidonocella sp. HB161398]
MEPVPLVHVLDDDPSMRSAVSSLLRSVGIEVQTYGSVREFLEAGRPDVEGCLVLDIRMPGTGGLELQEQLQSLGVQLPVVLMTGFGDIPMTVRGMRAGAVDFLAKPFRDQDMLDAVSAALARDRVRRASGRERAEAEARLATLSPRERQVMELVVEGLMNKQVAGELGLSLVTVKIHRGAAMRKMGARTLPDLVRLAALLGLGRSG